MWVNFCIKFCFLDPNAGQSDKQVSHFATETAAEKPCSVSWTNDAWNWNCGDQVSKPNLEWDCEAKSNERDKSSNPEIFGHWISQVVDLIQETADKKAESHLCGLSSS